MPRAVRLALFAVMTQLLFLLALEGVARTSLVPTSGLDASLHYGFDSRIEAFPGLPVRLVRIPSPPIEGGMAPPGVNPDDLLIPFDAVRAADLRTAFAFGGSTTAGRHCSGGSSSWPAELATLNPGLAVLNYAVPGSNSDRSLERLRLELSQSTSDFAVVAGVRRPEYFASLDSEQKSKLNRPVPDLVFWANWINERNVMAQAGHALRERVGRPAEYDRNQGQGAAPGILDLA